MLTTYKRCTFDFQYRSADVIASTFPTLLKRLCKTTPSSDGSRIYAKITYVIINAVINWKTIFYKPLLGSFADSSNEAALDLVKCVAFLSDAIGDANLWFGLETAFDSTNTSDFASTASSSSMGLPSTPGAVPKDLSNSNTITKEYVELICSVIVGKFNANAVFKVSKQVDSGMILSFTKCQGVLILELLWAFRKLRLASKHGYFLSKDSKEAIRSAVREIETRLSIFIVQAHQKRVSLSEDYKVLLIAIIHECVAITESPKFNPQWLQIVIAWLIDSDNVGKPSIGDKSLGDGNEHEDAAVPTLYSILEMYSEGLRNLEVIQQCQNFF